MGFGSFIGGVGLCILAVLLGFSGIAVLLGFTKIVAASLVVPFGIGMIIMAFIMLLSGWYLSESSKPEGTINVHNQ